jgi:acyl-homoserine lactone acylase PvdQ
MTSRVALLSVFVCASACSNQDSTGRVTIYRDRMGVPHVVGDTPEALYFGGGYALAQDRLAEFERSRRAALGRMAEIDSSKVEADKKARLVAYTQAETQTMFDALAPEYQRMIRAHLAGMNQAIDEAIADPQNKMPYEFGVLWKVTPERWTVRDYIATYAAHRRSLSSGGGVELANLEFYRDLVARHGEQDARVIFDDVLPLSDPDAIATIASSGPFPESLAGTAVQHTANPPAAAPPRPFAQLAALGVRSGTASTAAIELEPRGESRSIVIGPERSASGNVLMVHATSDGPQIHYLGAGFDAYGYTRQGGGPLVMGRGPTFGWFQSTGQDDMVDTFAEKLNPENRYQYWFDDAWHDMERRTEVIRVRDGEPQRIEIVRTVHGPVVAWDVENQIAYSQRHALQGAEMNDWVCNLEWDRAKNMAEFEKSIPQCASSTNIQYGDEDGHIAHWHAARLAVRPGGIDPRFPTPGTGEHEWRGWVPFSAWSKILDPAEGYLHVWNNKPTDATAYGDEYRWGATFRNYLAHDLIQAKPRISFDDLKEINRQVGSGWGGTDNTLTSPKFFVTYLKPAMADDARLLQAVDRMAGWNAIFEDLDEDGYYDDVGLSITRRWLQVAREMILADDIGDWEPKIVSSYRTAVLHRAIQGEDAGLPMKHDWFNGNDRNEVLRRTVARVVDELAKEFGTDDMAAWRTPIFWKYYDAEAIGRHPDKPPYGALTVVWDQFSPWSGSTAARLGFIPFAVPANGSEQWNGLMELTRGAKIMHDASPVGGQNQFISLSGKATAHIRDQLMLHVNYEFKKVPMTLEEIEAEAESVVVLDVPAIP